jgi:hypothetical protein
MTCHAVSPVSPHTRRGLLHWMAGTGLAGVAALACRAGTPAARAPEGDSTLQREAEADGIVRLQKMVWGSPLEKDTIERGLEVFHAQEQKIRVEYIHTPEDYDNKLQAMLAGGAAPDVFKVSGALYADYIVAGALRDITDQLARDPLLGKPDYFIQPFERERSTYKGRWYGIGSTAQEQILYYNVEVLNQAGVMPPPVDAEKAWEWLPFIQYARQLTVRTGGVAERFGAHWPTGTYGPAVVSNSGMIIDPKDAALRAGSPRGDRSDPAGGRPYPHPPGLGDRSGDAGRQRAAAPGLRALRHAGGRQLAPARPCPVGLQVRRWRTAEAQAAGDHDDLLDHRHLAGYEEAGGGLAALPLPEHRRLPAPAGARRAVEPQPYHALEPQRHPAMAEPWRAPARI